MKTPVGTGLLLDMDTVLERENEKPPKKRGDLRV